MVQTPRRTETLLADIILALGVEQVPELCKEMSKHLDGSLSGNSKGMKRMVTWLGAEFKKTKQEDRAKAPNQFQGGAQEEIERGILVFLEVDLWLLYKVYQALV